MLYVIIALFAGAFNKIEKAFEYINQPESPEWKKGSFASWR